MITQRQIDNGTTYSYTYNCWPIESRIMIYRTASFSMTLHHPHSRFQGHTILWRWISRKRYDIHSFNGILIGTYTRPTQQCRFEWPWVILSDLTKYSTTRSVARFLCDSWASCVFLPREPVVQIRITRFRNIVFMFGIYKNLAIANRLRVSCAHNTSMASMITPWHWNVG